MILCVTNMIKELSLSKSRNNLLIKELNKKKDKLENY